MKEYDVYEEEENPLLADPVLAMLNPEQVKEAVAAAKLQMEIAASELDFLRAAKFRDEMNALKKLVDKDSV